MATSRERDEAKAEALAKYDEDRKDHDRFVTDAEKCYRAYRGQIEIASEAAQWTNKKHPPYVFQIIETMVGALVDPRPRWRLTPSARFSAPPEVAAMRDAAAQLELLLRQQRAAPGLLRDQRAHRLQALITRLTAHKTWWRFEERDTERNVAYSEELLDDYGQPIGQVDRVRREKRTEVVHDDPVAEIVDVRHLLWPQHATSPEAAPHITHRLYYSLDELRRRECKTNQGKFHDGPCRGGIYHNISELGKQDGGGDAVVASKQAQGLFDYRPHPDDIEVLEFWHRHKDGSVWLTVVANHTQLLRYGPSPFEHDKLPFVVCSGLPYPFRIQGISDVEQIMEMQEMMWTLSNQRLDNLQLVNNAIILLREDVDDPDAFEFYPGARNLVSDPQQVTMWTPDVRVASVSIEAEQMLKQDLQAISGGMPWLSGDNTSTDSGTATEASILTNLAQRRVAAKKQFFLEADAEVGNQFIALNDQFLSEQRWIERVGSEGEAGWALIDPDSFREYRFRIELEAHDESLMRQERRAEKQALLQTAANTAPIFSAYSQAGIGPALNLRAFMDDFLEAHDVRDKDRYYINRPAPAPPGGQQQAANGQPQQAQPTAPQATDVNSPSNAFSQSPVAALQQMLAQSGPTQ